MKLRCPPLSTLLALAFSAGALLVPLAASAQLAGPTPKTISSSICDYASNLPADLQDEIEDLMQVAGFIGLPADQCDKFVKSLVKSCQAMARAATACSVNVNETVGLNAGRMSEIGCEAEPDRDSQKTCRSTARTNTKNNVATAGKTVQLLASRSCNVDFAAAMHELCLEGAPTP